MTKHASALLVALSLLAAGCSSPSDGHKADVASAANTRYCSGSEWVDDSSIAYLPIPVVAFFVPHADLNSIQKEDYVKRCGNPRQVVSSNVDISHTACAPAALTRILTLGVFQWCPAQVSWNVEVDR